MVTDGDTNRSTVGSTYGLEPRERGFTPLRVLAILALLGVFLFWAWALFFATKASINKIDDRAWAERAESICSATKAGLTELEQQATEDITARAALVIESTDLMSKMLDDLIAVEPTDEKGQAIVPEWIADYRVLLDNRYAYANRLRDGNDGPFTETAVGGVPITERLDAFARDNEMGSCSPPRGSVV